MLLPSFPKGPKLCPTITLTSIDIFQLNFTNIPTLVPDLLIFLSINNTSYVLNASASHFLALHFICFLINIVCFIHISTRITVFIDVSLVLLFLVFALRL